MIQDRIEAWLAKDFDFIVPVAARIVALTALMIILHECFDMKMASTEVIVMLAIGFTILDRQQEQMRSSKGKGAS